MDRFRFVLTRPLELIPVLIGISVVTFALIHLLPGNPAEVLLGPRSSARALAAIEHEYGLDKPVVVQYFYFVANLLHGRLGRSVVYKAPVFDVIAGHVWPTVFLVAYSVLLSIVGSIILGLAAALTEGRALDQLIRMLSTVGLGLPAFWIGVLFMMIFGVRLGWFPVSGFGEGFWGHVYYLFLPALTIAIALIPILTRNLRANLLKESRADYVTAARSKGLGRGRIWRTHIFRNSLLATVNLLGVTVSWLIGGTVVVETVFSIPGLGHLMVSSIFTRDYLVVEAVTMILALGIVAVNFLVDVATALLDPRVEL
ncbi:MAG: ABC transporter permease [Acetobacteraceae bacterium]